MNKSQRMLNFLKKLGGVGVPKMQTMARKEARSNEFSLNYCADIVKRHDYENFLATLLMSKSLRSPAFVIRAFNVEVARIQDQTTDPDTAAFRLQFWQDAITEVFRTGQKFQNVPANPVVQELYKVHCCYGIHRKHLEKLVTARRNLLKTKHFRSLEDVERYAEDTVSAVYYLLLSIAGVANVHVDHVASHLGKAQGIANTLRSVQVFSHHKMVALPMELLMDHQISQEMVLRGKDSEEMRNLCFKVATRAHHHLEKARSIDIPKNTRQLFLPAIPLHQYLTKLEKCNFNIFDPSLMRPSPFLPLNLYFKRLIHKF